MQRQRDVGKARRVGAMDCAQFDVSPWMDCRRTPRVALRSRRAGCPETAASGWPFSWLLLFGHAKRSDSLAGRRVNTRQGCRAAKRREKTASSPTGRKFKDAERPSRAKIKPGNATGTIRQNGAQKTSRRRRRQQRAGEKLQLESRHARHVMPGSRSDPTAEIRASLAAAARACPSVHPDSHCGSIRARHRAANR